VTKDSADLFFRTRRLRLDRTLISDRNPLIAPVAKLADRVKDQRVALAPDNPFLALEKQTAKRIEASLDLARDMRDAAQEVVFHAVYGTPAMRRVGAADIERRRKVVNENLRRSPKVVQALAAMAQGGEAEGTLRMLELLSLARGYTRRSRLEKTLHLFEVEEPFKSMSSTERAAMIHRQALIVQFSPEKARESLPLLLDTPIERRRALDFVMRVAGPEETMHPAARDLYHAFETMLPLPENAAA
jgi:hypothetical protein